jgi:glycosyltransferase involved in cell wall biosynthesis
LAGLAAAHAAGVPVVLTWHTDVFAYSGFYPEIRIATRLAGVTLLRLGIYGRSRRMLTQVRVAQGILSAVDTVIVPTPKVRDLVSWLGYEGSLVILPAPTLPVPPPTISPASLRSRLGIPGDSPVILAVGRLSREKNLSLLIRAFAVLVGDHPAARLVLVGPPRGQRSLRRLAVELGVADSVHIPGSAGRDLLGAYYRLATTLVVPSLTDTQALVAQEAEAFGIPVIVVDEGLGRGFGRKRELARPEPLSVMRAMSASIRSTADRTNVEYPEPDEFAPTADVQAGSLLEVYQSLAKRS